MEIAGAKAVGIPESRLDYASRYTALGWPVLPLHWITEERLCSCNKACKSPGKHPMLKTGMKEASTDQGLIKQWFSRWPNANIGIATGAVSGIFALDIDPRHGGDDSLDAIRSELGAIPDDVLAITGSGGKHYLFHYPGALGRSTTNLWPGIDTRGDGGYIVVAPSNHTSGQHYFWDAEADPLNGAILSPCPDWLLAKLAEKAQPESKTPANRIILPPNEVKKIRAALGYVPADDRDNWLHVGMALHSSGAGEQAFGVWCEWAQKSDKFNFADSSRVWASFKPGGGINVASIFGLAQSNGWIPPEKDRPPDPPLEAYADDVAGSLPKKQNPKPKNSKDFPLISASELTAHPVQICWLLVNFIEFGSLNLLFGEPGAAKSLIALEWAFCMAAGLEWGGLATKKTDVVIIAGEGFSGYARRLKALEIKYGMKAPANLFVSKRPAQLLDRRSAKLVADGVKAACPNPGLVVIDTMHRNADIDENSSQDIGKFINILEEFLKPLGVAVLIVHHSGHNDKGRSRGSSAIRGAVDAEFSATKGDGFITLSCLKSKDFESYKPLNFKLNVVELGWFDDDDEPVTSAFLTPIENEDIANKPVKLTRLESEVLKALDAAIGAYGVEPPDTILKNREFSSLAGLLVVEVGQWREHALNSPLIAEKTTDARRMALKRAKANLIKKNIVEESNGYVWRVIGND